MLLFVIFAAGFYMEVENSLNLEDIVVNPETGYKQLIFIPGMPQYSFTLAVYFIMITVATVGYGDYAPFTNFGMIITMIVLIITIIMVPTMVSDLLRLILMQSKYKRASY